MARIAVAVLLLTIAQVKAKLELTDTLEEAFAEL
jgi:hypothetical protein